MIVIIGTPTVSLLKKFAVKNGLNTCVDVIDVAELIHSSQTEIFAQGNDTIGQNTDHTSFRGSRLSPDGIL